MLIDKKTEVLERCIEMRLEIEMLNDWIVVAIDVGIDSEQTFEHLS